MPFAHARAGAGLADAGGGQSAGRRAADRSGRGGVRGRADGGGRAPRTAADARADRSSRPAGQRRWGDDLAGRQAVGRGQDAGDRDHRPGRATGEVRARDLSYFSRRAEHRDFRRLALVETHRRGVGTAGVVVAVMDGADWLQGFIDFHRRDAVRVLDFPHAVEYLTRASHEALGVGDGRDRCLEGVAHPAGPRPQARRPRPGPGRAAGAAGRRAPRCRPGLPGATAAPSSSTRPSVRPATRSAAASSRAPTRSSSRTA